mmetsp:Transcript_97855/g.279854  ORF Transcript_97855/g.279854 Transcript_97855/m.279854 type:complete len:217 (+) Transcript_97855:1423-2073(+)
MKSDWMRHEESARKWVQCISEDSTLLRPLSAEAVQRAFSYFDQDGNGRITLEDLERGCVRLGIAIKDAECDVIMNMCAEHEPVRSMNLLEFGQTYYNHMHQGHRAAGTAAPELQQAFALFDQDGSGTLSVAELTLALQKLAPSSLDLEHVQKCLHDMDSDDDGIISISEFTDWLVGQNMNQWLNEHAAQEIHAQARKREDETPRNPMAQITRRRRA